MKKNVLVFPCSSEIGLEIYRSLSYSTHFKLYGGSSVDGHGEFVFENQINNLPFVTDDNFLGELNKIIKKYNIDFILPAHDSVVLKLAEESSKGNLLCTVVTSPFEACDICRSKKKTYDVFEEIIKTPKVYETIESILNNDFPLFLKPDVGQGAKGTYKVNSKEEIDFYLEKDNSLLILEYLPGVEYTIDCFTDKNGILQFVEGRERKRIQNGISVNAIKITNDKFKEIAKKINTVLKIRGAWFFQLKERKNGELVLMEIAPRISGTSGYFRCKGINLTLLSLFDFLDFDVNVFENECDLEMDRALSNSYKHNIKYNHVYLDFDDLVIFEEKVNPLIMMFLYQCFAKKIKVHLITKHKGNLEETLEQYKISDLFDSIIHLSEDDDKYKYIKEKDSIFIDDSFAERKDVFDKCKIPVFDAHMIECLIN